jgi:tetratricopeptide (TPR) repeat protein
MKTTLSILFSVTLLLVACETGSKREKLLKEVTQAEQELFSKNFDITLEKKQHLMDLYLAFAEEFPQDSLAPELLFRCADIAVNSQQEKYAITLYQRIYDEFPDHAFRPIALLNQALVYDNMGDADHAKPLYEQFLVMFPDDPYATDVKYLLEMVGKSPEELELLMQEFENQEEIE